MSNIQTINISTSTIFRTILILLGLFFLFLIRDILVIVFLAVIIAAAINGPVSWLQERHVPRFLAVIFIYLLFLFFLGLVISLVVPPLADQVRQLARILPEMLENIGISVQQFWGRFHLGSSLQDLLETLGGRLSQATGNIFGTIIGLFGGFFSALVVLVIAFYLSIQEKGMKRFIVSLIPTEHQHYLSDLFERIQVKIGGWLRGQLLLMLIIGVLTYIGLSVLGIKYALTLALVAGLLELVPYIGPILSAIPAVILAFVQAPFLALLTLILYIVIQQMENYLIAPQVMKRAVGLNPIVIIIVMLIGAKLAGVLGLILAIPLAASVKEFLRDVKETEA